MELRTTFNTILPGKNWPDLLAGISIAGLILPEAIAYSGIAGMPPLTGIVGAIIGLLVYGLFGTSRFALVSATSASAAVLLAAIRSLMESRVISAAVLASALVIVAGILFLLCAAFRLGRIAHFIARPVVRGLALGLALIIVSRQVASIVGFHSSHSNVLLLSYELLANLHAWNGVGIALAAGALLLLNILKRWPRIPAPLLVIIAGTLLYQWLGLHDQGVAVVGDITLTGSSAVGLSIPALPGGDWLRVAELSVALMLILFAESYSSIRSTALQHADAVHVNRDLFALGLANLLSGLLGAMPVGAGYSATMTNQTLGSRSRLTGFVAGIYVLMIVLLLIRYVALIPEPVLAAIVIYGMQHALSLAPLRTCFKWHRDRLVVLITVLAVITLGVLDGLFASIAVSVMLLIRGLAQPRISILGRLGDTHDYVPLESHPAVHEVPEMLIIRPDEPLFFANADAMLEIALDALNRSQDAHTLILSLEESPNVDSTVIEALAQFAKRVHQRNCTLLLARLKEPVRRVLQRAQLQYLDDSVLNASSVAAVVSSVHP